ncbi:uncharacterized protein LOC143376907 isoform X2 [Andrena cerasifolii]|uniref:uncharacterized protein LOC143376907 isoform X2 n=1 Tax=Andrena cerasifolii TaxID=2819439 RepID=UPI0040383B3D
MARRTARIPWCTGVQVSRRIYQSHRVVCFRLPPSRSDIHSSRVRARGNSRVDRVLHSAPGTPHAATSRNNGRAFRPRALPTHAMKLALLVAIGCLVVVARAAEEEYDYEEEPAAAPVTPAPARSTSGRLGGLLSPRGRVNVGRKATGTTQSTTAKPVEQPAEVDEEGEEELEENQDQQEEVPTTTTESSKKVRGGVRPFRSNQDLLAALKRRRAQVGPSHRETSAGQASAEPTTPKSNGRSKSNGAAESKTSNRGRFGGSRGGKPLQEEVEETQREEVQVKPKPYRRG